MIFVVVIHYSTLLSFSFGSIDRILSMLVVIHYFTHLSLFFFHRQDMINVVGDSLLYSFISFF